jgi:hypothetical protein
MHFVKSFKGYEDKTAELDNAVNTWLLKNRNAIAAVVDIKTALGHEAGGRAGTGDLIYTVVYDAPEPIA